MPIDDVKLIVDGVAYSGWTDLDIKRSVETLSGSFRLSMVDIWGDDPITFSPNTQCSIWSGSDLLITGYLDGQKLEISPDTNIIEITGRCKTADLIDCSANNKPASWKKGIPIVKLIGDLVAPYNIKVITNSNFGNIEKEFSITTGQSVFDAISDICKDKGIVPIGTTDGKLLLTTIGPISSTDKLIYGINIVTAEGVNNFKQRFSKYVVKGQKSGGGGSWGSKATTAIFAEAFDDNISRNRVKVITADNQITNSGAQKRANWEAQVRAGRSTSIRITSNEWRQSDGSLWKENLTTFVDIPKFRAEGPMLIRTVSYRMRSNERSIELDLVKPDIYKPEPPKKIKKKSRGNKAVWLG